MARVLERHWKRQKSRQRQKQQDNLYSGVVISGELQRRLWKIWTILSGSLLYNSTNQETEEKNRPMGRLGDHRYVNEGGVIETGRPSAMTMFFFLSLPSEVIEFYVVGYRDTRIAMQQHPPLWCDIRLIFLILFIVRARVFDRYSFTVCAGSRRYKKEFYLERDFLFYYEECVFLQLSTLKMIDDIWIVGEFDTKECEKAHKNYTINTRLTRD